MVNYNGGPTIFEKFGLIKSFLVIVAIGIVYGIVREVVKYRNMKKNKSINRHEDSKKENNPISRTAENKLAEEKYQKCKKCGLHNKLTNKFCGECGTMLKLQPKMIFVIFIVFAFAITLVFYGFYEGGKTTNNPTNTKVNCPTGIFQSQLSYCVGLCMVGLGDSGLDQDLCKKQCDFVKYADGSAGLKWQIESYKCNKCGDCTPEQLQGIEEGKKQAEADAKLAYEKSIEDKKLKEEEQRIKDKQLKVLEKLEEKINIESEKLGGYIYIKNVSGKQQDFIDSGGINHAVVPSEVIKTDLETARKLLATEQFELVIT